MEKTNQENDNSEFNIKSWDDLDIDQSILRGIHSMGFENPSPIQQRAIKPISMGRDIVAQAQSGTGKTATFAIGALSRINATLNKTQVIILSPTKELTVQTASVIEKLGSLIPNLTVETMYGGMNSVGKSSNSFINTSKPQIICGCPGKINDMLRRNVINTSFIKLIIMDEVDEMLSTGFKEQVFNIFQFMNDDIQIALFSATMPPNMHQIVDRIVRDPVRILVKSEMLTLEGIRQFYVAVEDDAQKYETLKHIFSYLTMSQCIIYCNSVKRVCDLQEVMTQDNFPVCCIHRNMTKEERFNSFADFKNGKCRVLISTNVTSRGIDIQQVSTVINFDVPNCIDNYLHRIGRSGRWGRKGVGINFVTRRDIDQLRRIEQHYDSQINEMPQDLTFLQSF
jgi:translation initiation factor 4A